MTDPSPADLAAFGASEAACYLYPGVDQQPLRAAYCMGAASMAITPSSADVIWPGVKRAALEIAYDNGGINRMRSEKKMLGELDRWLARQPADILPPIDAWLAALSDQDLNTVCAGEETEQQALLQTAPPFTDMLLTNYFDEVC